MKPAPPVTRLCMSQPLGFQGRPVHWFSKADGNQVIQDQVKVLHRTVGPLL